MSAKTPDISALIFDHVTAIQETYATLSEKDRDFFLMGLRKSLQEALPSALGVPCINESVVDAIGKTKLVKLSKIQSVLGDDSTDTGEVVAKMEFTNPGLSVKDRIAKGMLLDAERQGTIKPYVTNRQTNLLTLSTVFANKSFLFFLFFYFVGESILLWTSHRETLVSDGVWLGHRKDTMSFRSFQNPIVSNVEH